MITRPLQSLFPIKRLYLAAVISLFLLVGCALTPEHNVLEGRGVIEKENYDALIATQPMREDVLLKLGNPDVVMRNGRLMAYRWRVTRGYAVVGGGDRAYVIPIDRSYVAIFAFDDRGHLIDHEYMTAKAFQSWKSALREEFGLTSDELITLTDEGLIKPNDGIDISQTSHADANMWTLEPLFEPLQEPTAVGITISVRDRRTDVPENSDVLGETMRYARLNERGPWHGMIDVPIRVEPSPTSLVGTALSPVAASLSGRHLAVELVQFEIETKLTLLTLDTYCRIQVKVTTLETSGPATEVVTVQVGTKKSTLFPPEQDDVTTLIEDALKELRDKVASSLNVNKHKSVE